MLFGKAWLYTYTLGQKEVKDNASVCFAFQDDNPISGTGITSLKKNLKGNCLLKFTGLTARQRTGCFEDTSILNFKKKISMAADISVKFDGSVCFVSCIVNSENFINFIRTFRIYQRLDININCFMPIRYKLPQDYKEIITTYCGFLPELESSIGEYIECEIHDVVDSSY